MLNYTLLGLLWLFTHLSLALFTYVMFTSTPQNVHCPNFYLYSRSDIWCADLFSGGYFRLAAYSVSFTLLHALSYVSCECSISDQAAVSMYRPCSIRNSLDVFREKICIPSASNPHALCLGHSIFLGLTNVRVFL